MLRYTVLLYPEPETGGYSVLVPVLGVATHAKTIDEGLTRAREVVVFQIGALKAEGDDVPTEDVPPIVASVEAPAAELATRG